MSTDVEIYNKSITATKYFTMNDAINSAIKSKTAFIIANERTTASGQIGRYYTVFPTFKEFLKVRDTYKHCHEILIDHVNSRINQSGRLVFDFDIKIANNSDTAQKDCVIVPKNFKKQIEDTILEVVEKYFNNIDIEILDFVWSTSQNPRKFSKHLTVKNMYFDDWIGMSKIFYQLFCIVWEEKYFWIKSFKLIDFQIVRKRGSLRMVGSKKIDGYPLVFDDDKHILTDSLIRIYFKNQRINEQLVTKDNINNGVFDNVLGVVTNDDDDTEQFDFSTLKPTKIEKPVYKQEIYEKAYEMYNTIRPGVFKMGKINGKIMTLIRIKATKCILSGKIHDKENAFLIINQNEDAYSIKFGCFRFCHKDKTIYIGSISIDNLITMINPNFEPPSKPVRRKKKIFEF